jgi:hypothetical protein
VGIRWDRVCLCGGVEIVIGRDPATAVKAEAALFPKAPDIRQLRKAGLFPDFPSRCLLKRFAFVYSTLGEDIAFAIPFAAYKRNKPTSVFRPYDDATSAGAISGALWLSEPALINRQEKPPLCDMQHRIHTREEFTGCNRLISCRYTVNPAIFVDVSSKTSDFNPSERRLHVCQMPAAWPSQRGSDPNAYAPLGRTCISCTAEPCAQGAMRWTS